VKEKTIKL